MGLPRPSTMPPIHDSRAPLLVAHALAGDLLMAVPTLRALGRRHGNHAWFPHRAFGLRFADGETLCGGNPPDDIAVDAVWSAYCRVRDRQPERKAR